MSLPSKLLFNNKINSSYAKNYMSVIQSQNVTSYGLGQTAIFNLPTQRNQVLSGADTLLSIKLRTRNGAGDTNNAVLVKGGIAGAIQRLRIFSGSQLLCDIDNYGTLVSLLTPYQSSQEHVTGRDQVLQGTALGHGLRIMTGLGANTNNADFEFAFPLLSILSLTDNYVPMYAMAGNGPLRVEVQFVSSLNQFIASTTAITNHSDGPNTVFSDCKMIANFVELSDAAMSIIEASLEGKPVSWVCQSYTNYVFSTTLQTAATTVSVPIPAKYNSLKALYLAMRTSSSAAGELTAFADDFQRFGLNQYTVRIGSKVIPAEPPTNVSQFLSEMERALGSASARISPSSYTRQMIYGKTPAQAGAQYELVTVENALSAPADNRSGAFAIGVETESYSSAPMGSVYQGLNTSNDDIFAQLNFNAQYAATVVRVDSWASFDQVITIDNGMVMVSF
jgi:hypothetical protein